MASHAISKDERFGLLAALGLHVLVLAVLLIQPVRKQILAPPERMSVNLVSDVGLDARAPQAVEESRASIAPQLDEETGTSDNATASKPAEKPKAASEQQGAASDTRPRRRPDQPRSQTRPREPQKRGGASRLGDNFLAGAGSSSRSDETRIPASQIGPSAKASIQQALIRQIRPHWSAPAGVDAEKLVTVLAFDLDENGRLKGPVRVVRQMGITASNRPQAGLHAERAIRAVELAAPFDLPVEFYNAWKSIRGARFDRNLSR